jgi:hypothetical protein
MGQPAQLGFLRGIVPGPATHENSIESTAWRWAIAKHLRQ